MKDFAIKPWVKILAWISSLVIVSLNVKLVVEEISGWGASGGWYVYFIVVPLAIMIGLLLLYIFLYPLINSRKREVNAAPHGNALNIQEIEKINYTRIGITVDFSKNDRNTIRHALIQGGKNSHYYLIHVVETAVARYHGDSALDYETQSDAENLEKYRINLKELGYESTAHIGYGGTVKAIVDITEENKLELLVMGAHGHKGLKDLILGTTVNSVRHKVAIPVLIVR
jgi:manganese transport protein